MKNLNRASFVLITVAFAIAVVFWLIMMLIFIAALSMSSTSLFTDMAGMEDVAVNIFRTICGFMIFICILVIGLNVLFFCLSFPHLKKPGSGTHLLTNFIMKCVGAVLLLIFTLLGIWLFIFALIPNVLIFVAFGLQMRRPAENGPIPTPYKPYPQQYPQQPYPPQYGQQYPPQYQQPANPYQQTQTPAPPQTEDGSKDENNEIY